MLKPAQVRMARSALKIGVRELADMADTTPFTVTRFETEKGGLQAATLEKLIGALERAGVTFLDDDGNGPGVRFKPLAAAE